MSGNKTVSHSRTWHFSHTLYTSLKPEACVQQAQLIHGTLSNVFHELFKQGPETVVYIHLEVSREVFDHCVACGRSGPALPNLPFSGFIQATSTYTSSCP
jgi:hypothetical protein